MTKTGSSRQYLFVSESARPPGSGLEGFDEVYEHEFPYVWRTLGRLGVPAADLPDAVHDVFVVLYKRWGEIDRERPIRPWLFGVARRVAAARRRRAAPPVVDPEPPADDAAAQRDLLYRALSGLDEDRRVVLILHDIEGYTGAEIAALLEIPTNTVHSRLRLARADAVAAIRRLRGDP